MPETVVYRFRFEKTGVMRFIGHLDVMRFFQKAIRRADFPVRYSEGYHPHMLMSFAMPLGVGLTSVGEYLEVELWEKESLPSPQDAVDRLNREMVEGLRLLSAACLPKGTKSAMSLVSAASYEIRYADPPAAVTADGIRAFYTEAAKIPVVKKTKKSERTVDLKPLIYRFTLEDTGILSLLLSAGSENNVKPELLLSAFHEALGLFPAEVTYGICRTDLYERASDGTLRSLSAAL